MSDYRSRKAERKRIFEEEVFGWKLEKCSACNGSGRYDHNGSPYCGACEGSGKTRYKDIGKNNVNVNV